MQGIYSFSMWFQEIYRNASSSNGWAAWCWAYNDNEMKILFQNVTIVNFYLDCAPFSSSSFSTFEEFWLKLSKIVIVNSTKSSLGVRNNDNLIKLPQRISSNRHHRVIVIASQTMIFFALSCSVMILKCNRRSRFLIWNFSTRTESEIQNLFLSFWH